MSDLLQAAGNGLLYTLVVAKSKPIGPNNRTAESSPKSLTRKDYNS